MAADYREFTHASLDILSAFQWQTIALVFDGKIELEILRLYGTIIVLVCLFKELHFIFTLYV